MSEQDFPRVRQEGRAIVVELLADALQGSAKPIRLVLDFDRDGNVIGVEIINLLLKVGKRGLDVISSLLSIGTGMRYAYDEQADAFALQIRPMQRSVDQKSLDGTVFLDAEGAIIGLQAIW